MADSGGSDWEVVSLTASTYAATPGPIPIPVSPIHKAESPLLLVPNPPAPPAHFFMSQHFNLPSGQRNFGTHLENSNGSQELESDPAVAVPDGDAADADDINMPICPEKYCETERDDVLVLASPAGNGLQVEGGGDEVQQTTTGICSLPDATAGSDAAAADATATLPAPAPAATVPVAAPSGGGNAAQAWWEKTYSFPRKDGGNGGTQPLAFRFVFVAGKLQLQEEDHLSPVPEFGQTQTISCAGNEPLGQVKVSMLDGGSPVSQQG